jgi:hypothetical protein
MSAEDMAVRLYEARRVLRDFYGLEYAEKVAPWRDVIRIAVARTGKGTVEAMLTVVAKLRERGQADGMVVPMLLAAAVEEVAAKRGERDQARSVTAP